MAVAIRHPLGAGADPSKDACTPSNRQALTYCLRLYFADALSDKVNKRTGDSEIGLPLADRFVSRLEIGSALEELRHWRADRYVLLLKLYGEGLPRRRVAMLLHMATGTLAELVENTLDQLIGIIWQDGE